MQSFEAYARFMCLNFKKLKDFLVRTSLCECLTVRVRANLADNMAGQCRWTVDLGRSAEDEDLRLFQNKF